MAARDRREDPGQYYPGGSVIPKTPTPSGGGGGEDANAVHYYTEIKTSEQKAQARANIGAGTSNFSGNYGDLSGVPQSFPPSAHSHESDSWFVTAINAVKALIPSLPSWLTPTREEPPTQDSVIGKRPVKPLPKYLHALAFDDPYKADAEAWYESLAPDAMGWACSAVRRGGSLYRNYDWTFDSAAEFVVKMSAAEGRHASVGVASLGAALTEDEVASGVYTAKYRALPGMTLDGINDAGVVCEINVDGGPKTGWHGTGANALHILAAVRWALDNGSSAAQVAEWLADHIIQPTGDMNFHFMVADATKTYIVENGSAHDVTDGVKVLTNYALYDAAHAGGGKERYQLLADGSDISAVLWTKAYQSGNDWHSDFESEAQHISAIEQWAEQSADKEAHRGRTSASGKPWWQTVHTTVYNFAAKTMRVAVQEGDEFFTFAAGQKSEVTWDEVQGKPSAFPPSTHTHTKSEITDFPTLATVATSGSYNDLSDTPTIPSAVTESTVSGWGFTKNAGTVTGITMNGASKGTGGVVDLGTVITAHQDISGKVDTLECGEGASKQTVTAENGVAKLDDFFKESNGFTPPTTVAGALQNSLLEKSIVLAVTKNFADADTTAYGGQN